MNESEGWRKSGGQKLHWPHDGVADAAGETLKELELARPSRDLFWATRALLAWFTTFCGRRREITVSMRPTLARASYQRALLYLIQAAKIMQLLLHSAKRAVASGFLARPFEFSQPLNNRNENFRRYINSDSILGQNSAI